MPEPRSPGPSDLPFSITQIWGYWHVPPCLAFMKVLEIPSQSRHECSVDTPRAKPSPQPTPDSVEMRSGEIRILLYLESASLTDVDEDPSPQKG